MDEFINKSIRCPDCHSSRIVSNTSHLQCNDCKNIFPVVDNKPILMRADNELFPKHGFLEPRHVPTSLLSKVVDAVMPSPSVTFGRKHSLLKLLEANSASEDTYILTIGCGQQRRELDTFLSACRNIHALYCDVSTAADVDMFCDAHELPFVDQLFDAVIITAVLEHVLCPEKVVQEVYRVLKSGGIVYSEIPFMQQVHEGAFDFTRYTLTGHRRLLNHFEELSSGIIAGAGTALVWAIEYFMASFVSNRRCKTYIRLLSRAFFFPLKYFDYFFISKSHSSDGASGTFFLGKKVQVKISDFEVVSRYFKE